MTFDRLSFYTSLYWGRFVFGWYMKRFKTGNGSVNVFLGPLEVAVYW